MPGAGIVGLVSAMCGAASVVMTDYHSVVIETATRNAVRNDVADKVTVCRLDWRHYLPADGELVGISAEDEYQYEQANDAPSHGRGCACVPNRTQYSRILASYVSAPSPSPSFLYPADCRDVDVSCPYFATSSA